MKILKVDFKDRSESDWVFLGSEILDKTQVRPGEIIVLTDGELTVKAIVKKRRESRTNGRMAMYAKPNWDTVVYS